MPWLDDLKQEEEQNVKELVKLGLMSEKDAKQLKKGGNVNTDKLTKNFKQKKLFGKDNDPNPVDLVTPEKAKFEEQDSVSTGGDTGEKVKTDAQIYSKTIKLNRVEDFDWKYDAQLPDP